MCKNYHNVLDAILKASNVQTNITKVIKNENKEIFVMVAKITNSWSMNNTALKLI